MHLQKQITSSSLLLPELMKNVVGSGVRVITPSPGRITTNNLIMNPSTRISSGIRPLIGRGSVDGAHFDAVTKNIKMSICRWPRSISQLANDRAIEC